MFRGMYELDMMNNCVRKETAELEGCNVLTWDSEGDVGSDDDDLRGSAGQERTNEQTPARCQG